MYGLSIKGTREAISALNALLECLDSDNISGSLLHNIGFRNLNNDSAVQVPTFSLSLRVNSEGLVAQT